MISCQSIAIFPVIKNQTYRFLARQFFLNWIMERLHRKCIINFKEDLLYIPIPYTPTKSRASSGNWINPKYANLIVRYHEWNIFDTSPECLKNSTNFRKRAGIWFSAIALYYGINLFIDHKAWHSIPNKYHYQ